MAVEGTKIAGMMALSARQPVGWISHLYLHPDFTGRGIGARLLDHAKETLGTPIRLYTFQANTGARRFYERHGFHPIHFCDGRGNEEKCPDVLYEFRVTPCPSMAEKSLHSIQPKAEEVK